MPFNVGPGEIILVLAIALLVLGPGRLPEVGASLGKTIREFRKASSDVQDAASLEPTRPPAGSPTAPTPDETVEARRTDGSTVPPAREA
jgi:sec-independent protein translocase protein TatA